jgi:hypothetical protein
MIEQPLYNITVQAGYSSAREFLETYAYRTPPENFRLFAGCHIPSCPTYALQQYLVHHKNITVVQMRIPKDGFASWLMPMAGKVSIALDRVRMSEWGSQTHMPVLVQMSRVMVHELAHTILHPRLVKSGTRYSLTSSDLEEEQAWVFAFSFFAIVAGDYSLLFRRSAEGDNTPCRFL